MVKALIHILMTQYIQVTGNIIGGMDMVFRYGMMEKDIEVSMLMT